MAIYQWDSIPARLVSPEGTLDFNEPTESPFTSNDYYLFLLDTKQSRAVPAPLRFTADPIPQDHGSLIRRTFKPGYTLDVVCELWVVKGDTTIACAEDLVVMGDMIDLHLNALLNPSVADAFGGLSRFYFTPSGQAERMFERVRTSAWSSLAYDGATPVVSWQMQTEFPYAMDRAEVATPSIGVGDTVVLHNAGTHAFYPVWRVYGPFTEFTLIDNTTGLYITYFAGFPGASAVGAGHFVEIDTFRNTVYLDGAGANRKAGIDVINSDFFPLARGDNEIQFGAVGGSGATHVTALWQAGWA